MECPQLTWRELPRQYPRPGEQPCWRAEVDAPEGDCRFSFELTLEPHHQQVGANYSEPPYTPGEWVFQHYTLEADFWVREHELQMHGFWGSCDGEGDRHEFATLEEAQAAGQRMAAELWRIAVHLAALPWVGTEARAQADVTAADAGEE